ncbi:hypothetical protein INR49_001858 [Caranx melampygus]|nr:hypothetical protein INR49_001858 [Caranx melampygus]
MSRRVGINILDFQSIRVRTVQGQQYQCQSGAKFHGGLEQKFILVDCQTVLYGTYSYTWAYEKINTSMVLVVTGQLACSYDEEFRRLYARSIVPVAMCRENLANHYMADSFGYNSDYASQLSLHQVHMKPTVMHGMRSAQDSWYNNAPVLTRGFSVQDRLHQIHSSDVGNLVRGHSYAGDLHKLHPTSRLRMGTKDPQVKTLRGDPRAQKQQLHQSRYGLDQNLIPFNSESSLNRWKIDTYLNESVMHLDRGFDVTSPIASPFSSQTGLNEQVHSRSRDIKSRMEEMRQRRLSLQDFNNLRQSQESLRSMYNPLERSVLMSSNRSLDMRQSLTDLQTNVQNGYNVDSAHQKVSESNKDGSKRETMQMYNRHEPHAAGSSVMKQNDPSLKHSHLHPSNLSSHLSRAMESLTEVPEEKEGSNSRINSLDSEATHHSGVKKPHREEPAAPKENTNFPADSQQQNQTRGSQVSVNSSESAASEGREKSVSNAAENTPKVINASAAEVKGGPSEKQREEPILQRKNSMKMKMQAFLSSDEKKASKKEDKDKSLQRKPSLRSQSSSGLTQPLGADQSTPAPAAEPPKSQNPELSGSVESEKHKSPLLRLSPLRSSKKKTAAEQDQGAKTAVETPAAPPRRKVYSRFEYLLSNENISMDTEKDRGASTSIQQTPSSNDNKLGRLMQRVVGNLRSKMS